MEWTIKIERGIFEDEEGTRRAWRAQIDSEPSVYGYGDSLEGAVESLLDALNDLPAEDER